MGGVFISYRREDSAAAAGRIYDRRAQRMGPENVFIDVDNIELGSDFVHVLTENVGGCDALVAVIGKRWISRRRLDDPHDFVRIEIEAALERGIRVIPVLVDGAAMPKSKDLPDTLKKLARRQAMEISHTRFDSDVEKLARSLAKNLSSNTGVIPGGPIVPRPGVQPIVSHTPLQLEVGESGEFFETDSAKSLYTRIRTLKLRVSNKDSRASLSECKVHVMDIEPHEYDGPWLLREGFSLAAGDHIFVPLASYLEPNNIKTSPYGASFIEILATKNRPKPPTSGRHLLTVRATALGSPFCEIKCALWVDESGRLRIERNGISSEVSSNSGSATQPASSRTIVNSGIDDFAAVIREYIIDEKIDATMVVAEENKIRTGPIRASGSYLGCLTSKQIILYGIKSGHTLEITQVDGEYYTLKDDVGNHPNGFQTKVTTQTPRWSGREPPKTQSEMLILAKRWLREQQGM